ncbi:hypothetical protein U7230_08775 [Carboxydochorda subterranea]|uniref:Uncharacterized protein n=1 Tax=Carboxydichorda subterranea TaxID=3109565 RepID=A0ABZ1BTS6_9FIRM|nr:hypothetical protein [Limnochorda sp. L945t]WRP16196.1 hypothetical protein U7230_08775 [Limnochorda sp. L945t]
MAQASASPEFGTWLDTLKGYVGEQVAADVLRSQGAVVALTAAPNQPEWDLLVNGEPYNVKVGVDPEHVARHFQEYPDVGVITSPELAAYFPEHADQIIALPELSNPALEHTTQQTVEAIGEVGWDFQWPIVTWRHRGFGSSTCSSRARPTSRRACATSRWTRPTRAGAGG